MVFKAKKKEIKVSGSFLFLVISVAVCAILALSWMLYKELYINNTKIVQENSENVVINNIKASPELTTYLLWEKAGCTDSKNVVYILREVGKFALVKYGCGLDASMFYQRVDGAWEGISPTNQFVNGVPLCSHLQEHKIPFTIQPTCYNSTISSDGVLPPIATNPVK